jgi:hypothetical protein
MKKVLAIAVLGVFVLASCKKEVACECSVTILGTTSTSTTPYTKLNKKDRDAHKSACETSSYCKQITK